MRTENLSPWLQSIIQDVRDNGPIPHWTATEIARHYHTHDGMPIHEARKLACETTRILGAVNHIGALPREV